MGFSLLSLTQYYKNMQFIETIVNTALLGTEKKNIDSGDFPPFLQEKTNQLLKDAENDKEATFLKISSIALQYFKAGVGPVKTEIQQAICEAESKPYCSDLAANLLKQALEENKTKLIEYWLKSCAEKNQLLSPPLLIPLLTWGSYNKKTQTETIKKIIGNRGFWLTQFNKEWQFLEQPIETTNFDWSTANTNQRIAYLTEFRKTNPSEAFALVLSTWKEENANTRVSLLETLTENVSQAEEEFLLSLTTDKSTKVQQQAWKLLKLIPEAAILKNYAEILKNSFKISGGKFLGLGKYTFTIKLELADKFIFSTGIFDLSNRNKVSDKEFILQQLIEEVHPDFWINHFQLKIPEIVKIFTEKEFKKYKDSLCQAIIKFKASSWAKEAIPVFDDISVSLLEALSESDQLTYVDKFITADFDQVIEILIQNKNEWSLPFSKKIAMALAEDSYHYVRRHFESIALKMSPDIMPFIDNMPVLENRQEAIPSEFRKLIHLKTNIKKAFL